jgi:hypothetical protein
MLWSRQRHARHIAAQVGQFLATGPPGLAIRVFGKEERNRIAPNRASKSQHIIVQIIVAKH